MFKSCPVHCPIRSFHPQYEGAPQPPFVHTVTLVSRPNILADASICLESLSNQLEDATLMDTSDGPKTQPAYPPDGLSYAGILKLSAHEPSARSPEASPSLNVHSKGRLTVDRPKVREYIKMVDDRPVQLFHACSCLITNSLFQWQSPHSPVKMNLWLLPRMPTLTGTTLTKMNAMKLAHKTWHYYWIYRGNVSFFCSLHF
jgi:hypothetical protein